MRAGDMEDGAGAGESARGMEDVENCDAGNAAENAGKENASNRIDAQSAKPGVCARNIAECARRVSREMGAVLGQEEAAVLAECVEEFVLRVVREAGKVTAENKRKVIGAKAVVEAAERCGAPFAGILGMQYSECAYPEED